LRTIWTSPKNEPETAEQSAVTDDRTVLDGTPEGNGSPDDPPTRCGCGAELTRLESIGRGHCEECAISKHNEGTHQ
jgi:hypothetical protein